MTYKRSNESTVTNWFKIKKFCGACGTYCFGSVERIFTEPEWETQFYEEASAFGFTVRIKDGIIYLDSND